MKKKTKNVIATIAVLAIIVGVIYYGNNSSQKRIIAAKLADVNRKISEMSSRYTDSSNADALVNLTIQKKALMDKYSSL